MSAREDIPRRTFRRHTIALGIGALWLLPTVFFGAFALDLGGGTPIPAGQRAVYAALALVFLALAVRTARIGVVTAPEGVTVRGVLRSRRLAWDDIAAFRWGGARAMGAVRRTDGRQVSVFALNPPFEFTPGQDRRVPELLAELNRLLAQARGLPEAPDSGAPPDPSGPRAARAA